MQQLSCLKARLHILTLQFFGNLLKNIDSLSVAVAAIRVVCHLGNRWTEKSNLSSLDVIGFIGEPIHPKAWEQCNEKIGKPQCALVDTF